MANAMDDARHDARYEAGTYRRMELITGKRRRRSWTDLEKARIVAESAEAGANISEVARRHGVARGVLSVWRRQAGVVSAAIPSFVPIEVGDEDGHDEPYTRGHFRAAQIEAAGAIPTRGMVEIELCGARIRVGDGVAPATLSMVLNVVRGIR